MSVTGKIYPQPCQLPVTPARRIGYVLTASAPFNIGFYASLSDEQKARFNDRGSAVECCLASAAASERRSAIKLRDCLSHRRSAFHLASLLVHHDLVASSLLTPLRAGRALGWQIAGRNPQSPSLIRLNPPHYVRAYLHHYCHQVSVDSHLQEVEALQRPKP